MAFARQANGVRESEKDAERKCKTIHFEIAIFMYQVMAFAVVCIRKFVYIRTSLYIINLMKRKQNRSFARSSQRKQKTLCIFFELNIFVRCKKLGKVRGSFCLFSVWLKERKTSVQCIVSQRKHVCVHIMSILNNKRRNDKRIKKHTAYC